MKKAGVVEAVSQGMRGVITDFVVDSEVLMRLGGPPSGQKKWSLSGEEMGNRGG